MAARSDRSGLPSNETDRRLAQRDHPDFLYVDPPLTRVEQWRQALTVRWGAVRHAAVLAGRIQWVLTFTLAPLLAFGMGQVSLVSPLVNTLAIPVMGAVGTPLTLAFAVAFLLAPQTAITAWLGAAAHGVLATAMVPATLMAQWQYASWPVAAAAAQPSLIALAIAGAYYALLPRGLPWRRLAWGLMLPVLLIKPGTLRPGEWRLVALDIGQGGAVVVLTTRHTVVFDTGLMFSDGSDSGGRVIAPYLLSVGRRQVDRLIISNRHADHYGGIPGLLAALPVKHVPCSLRFKCCQAEHGTRRTFSGVSSLCGRRELGL
jgi:competence protein ComEC